MEKVKVTREQAEAIEEIRDAYYAINIHSFKKRPDSPLAELETSELARALFVGYEVEPEFKVGDWVVHTCGGAIRQITEIASDHIEVSDGEDEYFWGIPFARHATPEEIAEEKEQRIWKKLSRQPYEFKMGDIVTWKVEKGLFEVVSHEGEMYKLTRDFCDSEFLVLTRNLKLVCPVENRLDVSVDE